VEKGAPRLPWPPCDRDARAWVAILELDFDRFEAGILRPERPSRKFVLPSTTGRCQNILPVDDRPPHAPLERFMNFRLTQLVLNDEVGSSAKSMRASVFRDEIVPP